MQRNYFPNFNALLLLTSILKFIFNFLLYFNDNHLRILFVCSINKSILCYMLKQSIHKFISEKLFYLLKRTCLWLNFYWNFIFTYWRLLGSNFCDIDVKTLWLSITRKQLMYERTSPSLFGDGGSNTSKRKMLFK